MWDLGEYKSDKEMTMSHFEKPKRDFAESTSGGIGCKIQIAKYKTALLRRQIVAFCRKYGI
jgi:hypothetical protein